MATEILWPQDCLANQQRNHFPRRRFSPIPKPNTTRNSPEARRRREGSPKLVKPQQQQKQRVIGHVTILQRGEPIEEPAARKGERGGAAGNLVRDAVMLGAGHLGSGPAMMPKQIRVFPISQDPGIGEDGYAGSAFSMSPSPRSLPLPSFSRVEKAFDQSATVGLRRLLRLE